MTLHEKLRETVHHYPDSVQEVIIAAALDLLKAHPDAKRGDLPRLTHLLWEKLRDVPAGPDGRTIGDLLHYPWHAPNLVTGQVLGALLEVGSLRATLEAERRRIDDALAALEPDALSQAAAGKKAKAVR